jgi:hypothetical protein
MSCYTLGNEKLYYIKCEDKCWGFKPVTLLKYHDSELTKLLLASGHDVVNALYLNCNARAMGLIVDEMKNPGAIEWKDCNTSTLNLACDYAFEFDLMNIEKDIGKEIEKRKKIAKICASKDAFSLLSSVLGNNQSLKDLLNLQFGESRRFNYLSDSSTSPSSSSSEEEKNEKDEKSEEKLKDQENPMMVNLEKLMGIKKDKDIFVEEKKDQVDLDNNKKTNNKKNKNKNKNKNNNEKKN